MKQTEATPERPFYSVAYQYKSSPWTLWSHNSYGRKNPLDWRQSSRTQQGTDNLCEAMRECDKLVMLPGICYAQVSMTTDCYNHKQVYKVGTTT